MEQRCYKKAREQFEKEWNSYVNSPYITSRFANTLWQLEDKGAR